MNDRQAGEPLLKRRHWRNALIWLVPVSALLIAISMLVQVRLAAGPEITIAFRSAAGLEAGKTAVKYKDVTVGVVKDITLSPDDSQVLVRVQLAKSAQNLTRSDTRFWVVRPRIGVSGVSGIDTLLSGAYIGVDRGNRPGPALNLPVLRLRLRSSVIRRAVSLSLRLTILVRWIAAHRFTIAGFR